MPLKASAAPPVMAAIRALWDWKPWIGRKVISANLRLPKLSSVCGKCHSDANFMRQYNPSLRVDQVAEYYTSVHGKRLAGAEGSKSCDLRQLSYGAFDQAAQRCPFLRPSVCASPILADLVTANADYMAPYKIPTDQVENFKKSVHWRLMTCKSDSIGADLQRLSWQPRRSAARGLFGRRTSADSAMRLTWSYSTRARIAKFSCKWAFPVARLVIAIMPSWRPATRC